MSTITQDMRFQQAVIEYSSSQFLQYVVGKFPYDIECIQTDNGFEFSNQMDNSKKKPLTLFEKTLAELGIQHKKIRPFTPRHNGKVERSHRKDNYACHSFYSFEDFAKQLTVRQSRYNAFPMRPLNWMSPKQVLFSSQRCNTSLTNLQYHKVKYHPFLDCIRPILYNISKRKKGYLACYIIQTNSGD